MKFLQLVPVGVPGTPAPAGALAKLAVELPRFFRVPCEMRQQAIDASAALDVNRGQYYSTEILKRLIPLAHQNTRVLGITALDLYVPVLTFVFGEAQLGGKCAVVSMHRLREEFYGLPPREELTAERLIKEAVHELGHTFGLRHCPDWSCVMASSHGVELLDVKGAEFCPSCRRVVAGEARHPLAAAR